LVLAVLKEVLVRTLYLVQLPQQVEGLVDGPVLTVVVVLAVVAVGQQQSIK
jgi:type IV secretory pathway VirB2 component (pilin)